MSDSSTKPRRVCFFGIDGATWKIIKPMVAAGRLPNLAAMMENGSYGILDSTCPANSSLAWTSLQTGVHPGKHGIFFFREQPAGMYQRPIVSWNSVHAPSIWSLANEHGKRVSSLYFPMTFPPEKVDGCMISGLLTPDRNADFIHPPELRQELQDAVGDVPSDNEPEVVFGTVTQEAAAEKLFETTHQIARIGVHAFEKQDWDLYGIVFRGVDLASHRAWCYQDPQWAKLNPKAAEKGKHLLGSVYDLLDAKLGEIRDRIDDDTTLVVASDHGFDRITHRFFVNKWLVDQGYLKLKTGKIAWMKTQLFFRQKFHGAMRRLRILKSYKALMKKIGGGGNAPDMSESMLMTLVDWSRTKAYSSFGGGEDIVIINLKGRQPEGCVEPGQEYETLREEIIGKVKQYKDPDGTALIADAWKREDLWSGPSVELAPDIQFLTSDTGVNAGGNPLSPVTSEPALDGLPAMHRLEGVYLMEGPGVVRKGREAAKGQIADIAVTMLHLLGLPAEDYMDGRLLADGLEPEWLEANPLLARTGNRGRLDFKKSDEWGTDEDAAKGAETLRSLGYLE